jgi:hypothetical protein
MALQTDLRALKSLVSRLSEQFSKSSRTFGDCKYHVSSSTFLLVLFLWASSRFGFPTHNLPAADLVLLWPKEGSYDPEMRPLLPSRFHSSYLLRQRCHPSMVVCRVSRMTRGGKIFPDLGPQRHPRYPCPNHVSIFGT